MSRHLWTEAERVELVRDLDHASDEPKLLESWSRRTGAKPQSIKAAYYKARRELPTGQPRVDPRLAALERLMALEQQLEAEMAVLRETLERKHS